MLARAFLAGLSLVLAACWAHAQTLAPSDQPPHLLPGESTPEVTPDNSGQRAWQVQPVAIAERPARIFASGSLAPLGSVRIVGESGAWYGLVDCEKGLCAKLISAPHAEERLPAGALPGSHIAQATGRISRAWLADPVQRIQGSAIGPLVAGALVVQDNIGKQFRLELGLDQAFEDLRPRIADIEGGGEQTLFVVRSSRQGAALIAVRLEGEGLLRIVGETPQVGRQNGWINPVGIADFTATGRKSIAIVTSPDQRGELEILNFVDRGFRKQLSVPGVSTHLPGTAIVDMAVIGDFEANNGADIAVPDTSRRTIRILSFGHGQIAEPADIKLPASVTTDVAGIQGRKGARPMLLMGLADGELVLLH